MTNRQAEVLALVRQGLCNKDIAVKLGVSESAIKHHTAALCKRAGLTEGGSSEKRVNLAMLCRLGLDSRLSSIDG